MNEQNMDTSVVDAEHNVAVDVSVPNTITEEKSHRPPVEKKPDDVEGFLKKNLGSKFATQNDGNVTNQYIFNIDRMTGDISSVQKEEPATKVAANVRQFKLYERQDCTDFVGEYKNSLHLAYAIAISMFEYVPVSDLQRLSESLLRRFPKTYDAEGKEVKTHISPFISLDAILGIIGAQTCKVSFATRFENLTERCVCFANHHETIMENLWDLFPMLRSEITSWLIETDFVYSFRNAFSTSCFVRAMSNIVKLDFGDSINRLFPQLVSREENKYLMIRLMLLLVDDAETRKNACEILRQWAASPKWLWEISLVVYALAEEEPPYSEELEKTLKGKLLLGFNEDWDDWNLRLIGGQMVDSQRLRSVISGILNKMATSEARGKNEYMASVIYLIALSNAYSFVDKDDVALPLVAVDSKKQLGDIEQLLYKIFADFSLRHGFIEVLEAYLTEIDEYNVSDRLRNQLKSYFYVIGKKSGRFLGDLQRFLLRLKSRGNKIAGEISEFLQEKLGSKELVTI